MVVHTPDELTEETTDQFLTALHESIEAGQVNIVAQMDRTDTYDSEGLTALVDLQEQLREREGNLKISGLVDTGRTIFEVTRLDQQLDLFDSVIDAVASYH